MAYHRYDTVEQHHGHRVLHLRLKEIRAFRDAFARCGLVDLTACIPAAVRLRVGSEVEAALDLAGLRRDLRIAATAGTPRCYRVLPRDEIRTLCPFTAALYRSETLLRLVEGAVGEAAFRSPYQPEEYVATRLERSGDTHGWHWDDYAFALVWVLTAPAPSAGGSLEFVAGVPWNKSTVDVDAVLALHEPERFTVSSCSVYLLRADTTMHRVAPLREDARRDALCFTYARHSDLERSVSHETLEQIYATSPS